MSSEDRPESLQAQAAAWVPPWERKREPDREYQAAAEDVAGPDSVAGPEGVAGPDSVAGPEGVAGPDGVAGPEGGAEAVAEAAERSEAEPQSPDEPESAEEPVGPATVDAPVELPGEPEREPTDVEPEPEIPIPDSIEEVEELGADPGAETAPVDGRAAAAGGAAPARTPVPAQATRERDGADAVGSGVARTSAVASLDDAELTAALEAILLVVDEPVGELQLAQIMEEPVERVAATLDDISARYTAAGHGFDLRRAAGGWRLYTRPEYATYVERFVLDGQSVRLTQAALETLAVVAYKQPVTRSRISAIRGVNCDGVMRTLVTRGLIEECGVEPETGAYLYRTTALFLEKLGLNSIDQLPPLAPFLPDDVEEVLDASG